MKHSISRRSLVAVAASAALIASVGAAEAAGGRMIFATQEAGSLYHTLGSGFSKLLSEKLERQVTVQPYAGSTVYLPLLDSGEATLGLSSSLDSDAAFRGADRAPLKKLRAVARLMSLKVVMMVRKDSGLRKGSDLKGKRVVIDLKGAVAMGSVIRAMLAAGGLKEGDVQGIAVGGIGDGKDGLVEGKVDATFIAAGIPLVKQAHASIPGGVAYVDFSEKPDVMAGVANGVYASKVEPKPDMPEVTETITSAAFDIFLLTSADTPDADVAAILKTLQDNFAALQTDYARLKATSASDFANATNTVPYHPGAVAYFKQKGMWTPANDTREKGF